MNLNELDEETRKMVELAKPKIFEEMNRQSAKLAMVLNNINESNAEILVLLLEGYAAGIRQLPVFEQDVYRIIKSMAPMQAVIYQRDTERTEES